MSRLRLRVLWPKGQAVRWRALDGMPEPKLGEQGGEVEALVDAQDLRPAPKPDGAPARFRRGRELDVSNYASWGEAASLMAPLFAEAERLKAGSEVEKEAQAIAARTKDPAARASAALALVQEKVRYVAQAMGAAGYTPATADQTWERRFGDCKGKTVLLIALLRALDIPAEPALVASTQGDGLDARLPAVTVFDHVIVRATVAGRDYWLDGTRTGDRDLAAVSTPDFGFVLPLRPAGATLVRLQPEPAKTPMAAVAVRIDASAGIDKPAPFHVDAVFRGDGALALKLSLANLAPDDLDRALRSYWRKEFEFVEASKVSAVYDPPSGEERISMDGAAKMDWSNGGYEADGAVLGWRFDAHRDPGPHADAPFAVGFPSYDLRTETITLPDRGRGFTVWGDSFDRELAGYAFHRSARIDGGVFRLEASTRALKPEITLEQARKDAGPMTELGKGTVRIRSPKETAQAQVDRKAILTTQPTTRSGYIERGSAFLDEGRYAEALKDFDKAVDLDPGSAEALAGRGLAHAWLGQSAAAKADLDRAETLDASEIVLWRGRGLIAQHDGRFADAVAAYDHALTLAPQDLFSLSRRSQSYVELKDYPKALADLDTLQKAWPDNTQIPGRRAAIYLQMKDPVRAKAQLAQGSETDETSLRSRITTLMVLKDKAAARALADRLVAAFPTARNYMMHAATREHADRAGAEADVRAAYAADKTYRAALAALAERRADAKDFPAALRYADALVATAPDDVAPRMTRAAVRQKAGHSDEARQDFAFVRARSAANAVQLNDLCYDQATANLDLGQALADCDASLALRPDAAPVLDSRGFVLLRLGRDRDAKAAFDRALDKAPDLAPSLYGRSLAERRLGDAAAADRDLKAAVAQDADVVSTFADYGVTR